jgi:hypothetical protein
MAYFGMRFSARLRTQATRCLRGFKKLIPGHAEKTSTRLAGTASWSSYRLTISKALVKARKCVLGLAEAIRHMPCRYSLLRISNSASWWVHDLWVIERALPGVSH